MFETKRTFIRPVNKNDSLALFNYKSDKELNKFQDWIPLSLPEMDKFIMNNPKNLNEPLTWFQLAIIDKNNDSIIGDIGIHFKDSTNFQSEIGCTIKTDYQNMGYATETLTEIINLLFTKLNKHRISVSIDPKNFDSIKLVEKLGFRREGLFKKSLFVRGSWVDDLVYGMLKSEWINR